MKSNRKRISGFAHSFQFGDDPNWKIYSTYFLYFPRFSRPAAWSPVGAEWYNGPSLIQVESEKIEGILRVMACYSEKPAVAEMNL